MLDKKCLHFGECGSMSEYEPDLANGKRGEVGEIIYLCKCCDEYYGKADDILPQD